MKNTKLYNSEAAAKFVGISTDELSYAKSNEIRRELQNGGENGRIVNKYHWSDLVLFRNSLNRKKRGGNPLNLSLKKAAKYLDISEDDLINFVRLGWVEPDNLILLIFSEFTLDKFMKDILAPISRIVDVRAL